MKQITKNNIVVGSGFSKLGFIYELRSNLPSLLRWSFDGVILGLVGLLLLFGWVNRYQIASAIGSPNAFYTRLTSDDTAAGSNGTDNPGEGAADTTGASDSAANQPVSDTPNGDETAVDPQLDPEVDPNGPPRPPEGEDMPPDPSMPEQPTGESGI